MAKMQSYEKQDRVLNQFQKQIRKSQWEERNPHLRELTLVEQIIKKSREEKAKYVPPVREFRSFYNPDNPLNGSSSWNREQREAYNKAQKLNKSNNNK